jgi:hypothetical protein
MRISRTQNSAETRTNTQTTNGVLRDTQTPDERLPIDGRWLSRNPL